MEQMSGLPVAQAAFGAALAALASPCGSKATATAVAAAARGAAQGAAAGAATGGAASSPDADIAVAINGLDEVLIGLQALMRTDTTPKVEEAKRWLRGLGGGRTASALGRLSSARNVHAHSMGKRVLAEAARLSARVDGDSLQDESAESDVTVQVAKAERALDALRPPAATTTRGSDPLANGGLVNVHSELRKLQDELDAANQHIAMQDEAARMARLAADAAHAEGAELVAAAGRAEAMRAAEAERLAEAYQQKLSEAERKADSARQETDERAAKAVAKSEALIRAVIEARMEDDRRREAGCVVSKERAEVLEDLVQAIIATAPST